MTKSYERNVMPDLEISLIKLSVGETVTDWGQETPVKARLVAGPTMGDTPSDQAVSTHHDSVRSVDLAWGYSIHFIQRRANNVPIVIKTVSPAAVQLFQKMPIPSAIVPLHHTIVYVISTLSDGGLGLLNTV